MPGTTRKDKVLDGVQELCTHLGTSVSGVTATEVATYCKISRENASRELNRLCVEGKIIKASGRPVRFRPTSDARQPKVTILETINRKEPPDHSNSVTNEAFRKMIGYDGTLQLVVEKAKAAMIYPGGLHTLITGPTGSGKTMLAHAMYEFAVQSGSIRSDAHLVVFNCAEYARNEELLASHLFGHIKGAFTGADRDQPGLVERADGGILLLDEVHRLPPSAQEMLFLLMDSGIYRRLGEAHRERKARVTIIACTTEEPDSALLQTFLRRVPVLINMPAFQDWSAWERALLVRYLLAKEAERLGKPILVDQSMFEEWMDYRGPGNVGYLKSIIQVAVARALLKSGKTANQVCLGESSGLAEDSILVRPGDLPSPSQISILNELSHLIENGLEADQAFSSLSTQLTPDNRLFMRRRAQSGAAGLAEYLLPDHIRQAATRALDAAARLLGTSFNSTHHLRLALHLATTLHRSSSRSNIHIRGKPILVATARAMLRSIEESLGVQLSTDNITYLVRFLSSAVPETSDGHEIPGTPVILATCYSGDGTAKKVRDTLRRVFGDTVSIVCCDKSRICNWLTQEPRNQENVVAAVGTVNPRLPAIPFIPVEDLIMGDGLRQLVEILGLDLDEIDAYEFSMACSLTMTTLLESMVFLNPHKALSLVETFVRSLENSLGRIFSKAVRVRLMVHTACMLERLLVRKLSGHVEENSSYNHADLKEPTILAEEVRKALSAIEHELRLRVPEDEVQVLTQILQNTS